MTQHTLSDNVRSYLDEHFPGSSIDNTYYFVTFNSPVNASIPEAQVGSVAANLAQPGAWLITVGVDPRAFVKPRKVEQSTVLYQPDWNIEKKLVEWIIEIDEPGVDMLRVLSAETSPGAAAIVDGRRHLLFDANARRVHAADQATLDAFLATISNP